MQTKKNCVSILQMYVSRAIRYGDLFITASLFQALDNGHEDIESIRIVRDPATLVGKGFGYLLLKDREAVLKALSLHQVE